MKLSRKFALRFIGITPFLERKNMPLLRNNLEINFYRKRLLSEELGDPEGDNKRLKKKKKVMEASTPINWRTKPQESPEGIIGITPIRPSYQSPDLVPPALQEFEDDGVSVTVDKGRTINSNELRGPLFAPRKIETEEEENLSLVKETVMLVRSSASNLCLVDLQKMQMSTQCKNTTSLGMDK